VGVGFGETLYSSLCLALFDFLPADDVYRHRKRIDALRDSSHRTHSPRPGAIKGRAALMSDIFISYKREEQAMARNLANALESEGWTVWWDPKLRAGDNLDDAIEKALNEAKCVIVMWSSLSVNSEYIKNEATEALEQKKLVPVKIEDVNLPFRFKRVQTQSLLDWDGSRASRDFRKLVGDISAKLSDSGEIIPDHTEQAVERQRPEIRVTPPAVDRPYNLSFDMLPVGNQPPGWFNSDGFVADVSTAYEIRVVPRPDGGSGACVLFQNPKAAENEFGSLMQRFPALYLVNKTIRLEGEVRTKNVAQWAGLWLRADDADGKMLDFDNMESRPIRGTTSWTKYVIQFPLPSRTMWLNYGIVLVGRGMMWADNFQLKFWGGWLDV
jgi:TIR domain